MNTIPPELIAEKIEAARHNQAGPVLANVPDARLFELLWFIQAVSVQPNGLDNLVNELLAQHPDAFVTRGIKSLGVPKDGSYTLDECLVLWRQSYLELNEWQRDRRDYMIGEGVGITINYVENPEHFTQWVGSYKHHSKEVLNDGVKRFNFAFYQARCQEAARQGLRDDLRLLCAETSAKFAAPRYCPDLLSLLLDYMDNFAAQRIKAVAQTETTKTVFRELEFAWSQNVPVPIVGESRIGKTSPASAWCAARPGRARLVTVPESNRMRDFIEAHADAFGIEHSPKTTTSELTRLVKYVHQHSGLFVCYDESQFLVPTKYDKVPAPPRLDFVRCQVIDRGLGCAFFATPQSYRQTLEQYVKTTGYKIEQWLGRLFHTVILPPDLGRDDLLAIARLNFPEMPEPFLKLIAAKAMQSEGGIKMMEFTAKRARFIASEQGRVQATIEDVKQAIQEIAPDSGGAPALPPQPARSAVAAPPRSASPTRATSAAPGEDLPDRSLQPICPARGGIELTPAGE